MPTACSIRFPCFVDYSMSAVMNASPQWRNSKRKGRRRQIEEQNVFMSWIFGLTVWFLIGLTVWLSSTQTNRSARRNSKPLIPSVKEYNKMKAVARKLQQILQAATSTYENRDEILARLQATTAATAGVVDQPWSASNPLNRALYWLSLSDDEGRLSLQRYALAVLYFYTTSGGEPWNQCGAPQQHNQHLQLNSKSCPTTAVLTTTSSECDWFGITCSPERQVTRIEWTSNNLSSDATAGTASDWPDEILLLPSLELLWWADNPLMHMRLPAFLNKLSNLQSLSLHRTQLHGKLPDSIYQLTKLRALRLYETHLSGTISTDIGRLSDLDWLWLHNTRLVGSIPTEIGHLKKLEGLTRK